MSAELDEVWTLGDAHGRTHLIRPLRLVFDQLAEGRDLDSERWQIYPLVIGLGSRAEHLVDQIPARVWIYEEVGLYRTGPGGAQDTTDWLARRLEKCLNAVLIIDATDPRALAEAAVWAEVLIAADVYIRSAILVAPPGFRRFRPEPTPLPLPMIQVLGADESAIAASVYALLPMLPFTVHGLICNDIADFHRVFRDVTHAWTTTARWMLPDDPSSAIASACARVRAHHFAALPKTTKVLMSITGDGNPSWAEWDSCTTQVCNDLNPDYVVSQIFWNAGLAKGERELSLTITG